MLTLINTNLMTPPISPIGLDYIATHLRKNKIETNILDLALADDSAPTDHNYNDNTQLVNAIANGARGAYWHILRQIRDS